MPWASSRVRVATPAVNKAWFEQRLADREISQRGLARLMNMDASAVSLMLSGKRGMSAAEASDVARLLGVTVEEVMRHAGIAVPVDVEKSVPIVGAVDERGGVRFGRVRGPQTVEAPPGVGQGCQALRVVGGVWDGWIVVWRPIDGVSLEAVGRLCVVRVVGEEGTRMKMVLRGYEAGWHVLVGFGATGGEQLHVQLESAAPVLWLRQ